MAHYSGSVKASLVAIGQLLNLLHLDLNARRVRAEVDLVPKIVQVPPEGVPVLADRDGPEIGLILQRCESRPVCDQLGEIVFSGKPVIEGDAQDRVADNLDALDPVLHSSIMPPW